MQIGRLESGCRRSADVVATYLNLIQPYVGELLDEFTEELEADLAEADTLRDLAS